MWSCCASCIESAADGRICADAPAYMCAVAVKVPESCFGNAAVAQSHKLVAAVEQRMRHHAHCEWRMPGYQGAPIRDTSPDSGVACCMSTTVVRAGTKSDSANVPDAQA